MLSTVVLSIDDRARCNESWTGVVGQQKGICGMSLADRVSQQLSIVEQSLVKISSNQETKSSLNKQINVSYSDLLALRQDVFHLQTLCQILNQFGSSSLSIQESVNCILNAVQQIEPVSFSAVILRDNDEEEGPYYYYALNGIQNTRCFTQKACNFSYSGMLARAMYQRLSPEDPDYVYLHDLSNCASTVRKEFPWMPQSGSLLVIPLRTNQSTEGVLLLGKDETDGFADLALRDSLYDVGFSGSNLIYNARMALEVNKHEEQLVNAQLLTREISNAHCFPEVIDTLLQKIPEITADADVKIILQNSLFDYSKGYREGVHCDILGQPFRLFSTSSALSASILADFNLITPLIQWTIRNNQPVFFTPEQLDSSPEHPSYSNNGRSIIVPIRGKDISYGVIYITAHVRQFDESDMVVLRTIANSVAITLRGIYMHDKYNKVSQDNSILTTEENVLLGLKKLRSPIYSPSVYTGDSDAVVPWLMAIE